MINIDDVYAYLSEHEPEIANSIGYASEMLLSQIDKAIDVLKQRRIEAVNNDEDDECELLRKYRDRLKEYKQDINTYLNYATKKIPNQNNDDISSQYIPGFETDTAITQEEMYKTPPDYKRYNVNSSKPHTLDENYTHKKICAFMFNNIKYTVNSWQETIVTICSMLALKSEKTFDTLIDNPKFKGRKVSYFGYNSVKGRNMRISGSNVYVWTNLSANEIVNLISNVLIAFGEKPSDFYIYLRADYTELHYGKQDEIENGLTDNNEKIGKHVQKCMRELESKKHTFSHNELLALLNAKESKKLFGITYPFFTDSSNMVYDKNGRGRYWKDPFKFNDKLYYITSQWFEYNRKKFDLWFNEIKKNVR